MNKKLLFLALISSSFFFGQVSIPKQSEKGKILTTTNQTIDYKNLKYEKGKISYINATTNQEEFLYDGSVKSLSFVNSDGKETQYQMSDFVEENNSNSNNLIASTQSKETVKPIKLTDDKEIRSYLEKSNNQNYLKGKSLNRTGNGFLIGGAACFVVGGIINLSSSSETATINNQTPESKGSPIPLIIGAAGMLGGLIMKISGKSQMNNAVTAYKTADNNKITPLYFAKLDNKGLGLEIKF